MHKPMSLVEMEDGNTLPHVISNDNNEGNRSDGPKFKSFLRKVRQSSMEHIHSLRQGDLIIRYNLLSFINFRPPLMDYYYYYYYDYFKFSFYLERSWMDIINIAL